MDAALARLAGAVTTVQQTAAMEPIARFVAANLRASLGRGARPLPGRAPPGAMPVVHIAKLANCIRFRS